jgi:hypothetical protein
MRGGRLYLDWRRANQTLIRVADQDEALDIVRRHYPNAVSRPVPRTPDEATMYVVGLFYADSQAMEADDAGDRSVARMIHEAVAGDDKDDPPGPRA